MKAEKDMTEQERAEARFTMRKEDVTIIFVPQCCDCRKNQKYKSCKQFKEKPVEYMTNEQLCKYKEK